VDDAMLVRAALAGDHEAYGQLVDLHRRGIVGLSYRAAESVSEAEILAHDAFVEAYLKLDQLRDPGRFGPWVRSIALNLGRAWLREQTRWSTMPDESEIETEAPQDEEDDPGHAQVGAGLARLSPMHRTMIGLYYVEGLSYQEISRLLEVPPGTVMSRLHRARTALREEVRRLRDDDVAQVGAQPFVCGVEAEIAALAATFGKDRAGATRLSVLLGASPATGLATCCMPLGATRRHGAPWLAPWFSPDRRLSMRRFGWPPALARSPRRDGRQCAWRSRAASGWLTREPGTPSRGLRPSPHTHSSTACS